MITFFSCSNATQTITKPEVLAFGSSLAEMKKQLKPLSEAMTERLEEPIQLPTAQDAQSQLDVSGFLYAGKKRNLELIFADDALDIIWILTEAEEEAVFLEQFEALYGAPTHVKEEVTFFLNDGVAVKNNPHEVLFISDRLKEPYKMFLESAN